MTSGWSAHSARTSAAAHITKGRADPVCNAYAAALREVDQQGDAEGEQTQDSQGRFAPWCALHLNPSVAGFPQIKRVLLTPEETAKVYDQMIGMTYETDPQVHLQPGRRSVIGDTEEAKLKYIRETMANGQLAIWRFEPELDVDNDGTPEHVLQLRDNRCWSERPIQVLPFIFGSAYDQLDAKRTKRLFGDPRPPPAKWKVITPFIALDDAGMYLFRYMDKVYVATWFYVDSWNPKDKPRRRSRVYVWQRDEKRVICEIVWK